MFLQVIYWARARERFVDPPAAGMMQPTEPVVSVPSDIEVRPGCGNGARGKHRSRKPCRPVVLTSVPIPKFASVRGILSCELRNQRNTSNINAF